jgi:hypothetical protein
LFQPSPRVCGTCKAVAAPGQQFCANCGATLPDPLTPMGYAPTVSASEPRPAPLAPTVAASAGPGPAGYVPTVAASEPSSGPAQYPPASSPPPPPTPYPANQYSTTGAPPPYQAADPYMSAQTPGYSQPSGYPPTPGYGQPANYAAASGYGQPPGYAPAYNYGQPQKNKSPLWLYITIGIVVLVVVCGGGLFALVGAMNGKGNSGGGNNTNSNYSDSQTLSNLSIIYASDQITFTSIQQASSFKDDDLTSYGHPDYVRINFKEQQTSNNNSDFGYVESFRLILPDHSVVAAQNAGDDIGPQQAVVRTNWVDFPTSSKVDLSNLALRLGAQGEAQMDIPLKSGANLSQYQPKTVNPNTQFQYAKLNWTIPSATQSLYFNGQQAKTGQVYITVNLRADNNSTYEVWLYGSFVHLNANGNSIAPDLESNTNGFDDMQPGTTNHQGSVTFLTQPDPNGKYVLDFLPDQNNDWPEQTVNLTIS